MSLAGVGTKGAQGAKSTDEAATNEAANWVWAAYAQHMPKGTIKIGKPKAYTTKSGVTGSVVTATAPGVTKKKKCDSDGKSIAFSFKNKNGSTPRGSSTPERTWRANFPTPRSRRSSAPCGSRTSPSPDTRLTGS